MILQEAGSDCPLGTLDLPAVAGRAENFSGSDLRELCRLAVVARVKDLVNKNINLYDRLRSATHFVSICRSSAAARKRPLTQEDLMGAVEKYRISRVVTGIVPTLAAAPGLD